jgi:hypothetical protein
MIPIEEMKLKGEEDGKKRRGKIRRQSIDFPNTTNESQCIYKTAYEIMNELCLPYLHSIYLH